MQAGSPMELYHEPANLFVAGFLGAPSMNFMAVTVDKVDGDSATVSSASLDAIDIPRRGRNFSTGQAAVLGVRPQYLQTVAANGGRLHGTVRITEISFDFEPKQAHLFARED